MEEKEILKAHNFEFKKKFGQNFLTDKNLLKAIAIDANITKEDEVLEIGPGAGALTYELATASKKVVCYEIDKTLKPILEEKLKDCNNVEVVFEDILKESIDTLKSHFNGAFKVVANLPYYITTPIIFHLLENDLNITSLTIMVQKEVAERLVANKNTKDYGILTINAGVQADITITRIVGRQMFHPAPNVDSAIVHFNMNKNKYDVKNLKHFTTLVKASFAMRRKTLMNNLKQKYGYSNEEIIHLFSSCNIKEKVRAEDLSIEQFVALSNKLNQ